MNGRILGAVAFAAAMLSVAGGERIPYFNGDIEAALDRADASHRLVVVSLGREICGRCQKFYGLLATDRIVLDETKCVYLKLNVDEMEQREYFMSWFVTSDSRLPFVGVLDPNARTGTCLTAACDVPALKGLLGPLAKFDPAAACTGATSNACPAAASCTGDACTVQPK